MSNPNVSNTHPECLTCNKPCYTKEEGKLIPRQCYMKKYLETAYSDLLVGPPASKEQSLAVLNSDLQPNSMIYYPYPTGKMRSAALALMKLKVPSFKVFHTHLLIDIFVSKEETYQNFSSMYSPFFLLLHGFIVTPNRRLLDLIREFLDYRMTDHIPFLLFSVTRPDPALISYFKDRGLPYTEILTKERKEAQLF